MQDDAEIPDDRVTVEFIDLAEHARSGQEPVKAHSYGLTIEGVSRRVHQHRMTATAILDLVEKGPEDWILEVEFHGGEKISLDGDDVVTFHSRCIVAFHARRRDHGHHGHRPEPFVLNVVVDGDEVHPAVTPSTVLSEVIAETLKLAKPVGRGSDEWEIKNEAGVALDQSLTIEAAGITSGTTVFVSLKIGAAGDGPAELLVDPAVSRAKFDAELLKYRAVEERMTRRGQWLIKAEFPEVFVVYGALPSGPLHVVAFGAVLDFTNYDLWPASVKIVHPFTRVPYKAAELPVYAALNRSVKIGEQTGPGGARQEVMGLQPMMQSHSPDSVPFLCMPGVREYHLHPAHTGDNWLLRRSQGEGTLYHLLDTLHRLGPAAIVGTQVGLHINPPRQ